MKRVHHTPAPRRPSGRRVRALFLAAAGALSLAGPAAAQQTTEAPPLIALHYQDVLADDPGVITVTLSGPSAPWSEVSYSTDSDCVTGEGRAGNPGDAVLALPFQLTGQACVADVDFIFHDTDESWPAWARLVLHRLPEAPELQLHTRLILRDVSAPGRPLLARNPNVLAVTLHNDFDEPLEFRPVADAASFLRDIGEIYQLPDSNARSSYTAITVDGRPLESAVIEPGADFHYVVIVDTQGRLPSGHGTGFIGAYGSAKVGESFYLVPTIQWSTYY